MMLAFYTSPSHVQGYQSTVTPVPNLMASLHLAWNNTARGHKGWNPPLHNIPNAASSLACGTRRYRNAWHAGASCRRRSMGKPYFILRPAQSCSPWSNTASED